MRATTLTRTLLPILMFSLAACDKTGESSDEKKEATEQKSPSSVPTGEAGRGVQPGQGAWRVFLILDTSADHSFFAPEQALTRVLDGTGIKVVRAWALGPVEIKNDAGEVIATVDLKNVTDQGKGYVFIEDGRIPDFVAPASLPFVLQQASAYYGTQIKMNNGRNAGAGMGAGGGGMGAAASKIKGNKIPSAVKNGKGMKMQKGAAGARKVGSKPTEEVTGEGTTEQ